MVVPLVFPKVAEDWLHSCYRAARKLKSYGFLLLHRRSSPQHHHHHHSVGPTTCSLEGRGSHTSLCDFDGALLRSPSLLPYFMLLAFEASGPLRALLILLASPIIFVLGPNSDVSLRAMCFIALRGLRPRDVALVARAVLPKFYLEELHLHAWEMAAATGKRVVVTAMPTVMVEGFAREYLDAGEVVGAELEVVGGYYTGFMAVSGLEARQRAVPELFGENKADVGLVGWWSMQDHQFISCSKEIYLVNKEDNSSSTAVMPRNKYPKPLVFHDSRLAFLPTPAATAAFFLWLPLGILLSVIRIASGVLLPYGASILIVAITGVRYRVSGQSNPPTTSGKGVLYVCTHRTLLDPVMLSIALSRPVPTVTYSLSRMSELIAPMRTVRLTRNRERDAETMCRLLATGDLAVCPEGTTCREPYLLRFSPLFAELAEEVVPVGMEAAGSDVMYGTTAGGRKWLDPVAFMANPMPAYRVVFLDRLPPEMTCKAGLAGWEVANGVQRRLGTALGYECTGLTRRDKYLMLAGNEGLVRQGTESIEVSGTSVS